MKRLALGISLIVLAGCGASQHHSVAAAASASTTSVTSVTPTSDPISQICDRDESTATRQIVTDDLVALGGGGNPPSRDRLAAAQNALTTEASDLGQAGDTTVQSYVSDEAQALSSQLSGQPAINVELDLTIAVTRRAGAATQANEPGCVVVVPAPGSAPTSTAATPGSLLQRAVLHIPGTIRCARNQAELYQSRGVPRREREERQHLMLSSSVDR